LSLPGGAAWFRYRVSGIEIASERPLAAMATPESGDPAPAEGIVVRFGRLVPPPQDPCWLIEHALEDGRPWLSVGRTSTGYLLRHHRYADFWVQGRVSEILVDSAPSCLPEVAEQLLLDSVLPVLLQLRGDPAFHASAVRVGRRGVVALLGVSGQGKSTLAASLATSGERDPKSPFTGLVSDDCLATSATPQAVLALQSYPALRLLPDSAAALFAEPSDLALATPRTSKRRVTIGGRVDPLPLLRLYLLARADGEPTLTRLRGIAAFKALLAHVHRIDPERRDCMEREMSLIGRLAAEVPVLTLAYRRRFEDLDLVRHLIQRDLAASLEAS
jgi:hypothetical protein